MLRRDDESALLAAVRDLLGAGGRAGIVDGEPRAARAGRLARRR